MGDKIIFHDDFIRPDEPLIASPSWSLLSGSDTPFQIVSNKLVIYTLSQNDYVKIPDLNSPNYKLSVTFEDNDTTTLLLRYKTGGPNVQAYFFKSDNKVRIFGLEGGVSFIYDIDHVFVPGQTLSFIFYNNFLFTSVDGVFKAEVFKIPLVEDYPLIGLRARNTNSVITNFLVEEIFHISDVVNLPGKFFFNKKEVPSKGFF